MKNKFLIALSVVVLSIICILSLVACGNKYAKDPIIGTYLTEDGKNYVQIVHCKTENADYEDEAHFKITNTCIFNKQFFSSEIIISYNKKSKKYIVVNDNDLKLIISDRVLNADYVRVTLDNLKITLEFMDFVGAGFVKREITFTRTSATVDEWEAGKPWLA